MKEEKLLHIYCGNGKGKTTAAIGLAVRAAGQGYQVFFCQFMKGNPTGELNILKEIPHIQILRPEKNYPFFHKMTDADKRMIAEEHNRILDYIEEHISSEEPVLVVLDEITYTIEYGLIDEEKLYKLLEKRNAEYVITGRRPTEKLQNIADYITEMKEIMHPYRRGIEARKGIEY